MVDILPAGVPRIARLCRLVGVLQLARGARSRGRRVPIEGVLLIVAFLRGGAQTTRTGSSCFLWTGQPDPRDRNPVIHTPHEPPLDFQRKRSGEDRRARNTRGTCPRRVLSGQRGWRSGRQGIPLALLTQEARDGGCPQRSTRCARRDIGSRTTIASPPQNVPAPPRGRMCDTGHDDPGLQPADPLRRHTEQQKINVILIKTVVAVHRTCVVRKNGARQTSFLAHLSP